MDSARPSGGGASGRAGRARPARGRFPGGRRARLLQSTFRGHRSPGLTSAPRSACARPPFWAGTLLHLRAGALMALDSRPSPRPCPPGCLPCKHPGSTSPSACQRRGRHRSLGDLSAPQSEIEAASVQGVSPRTQVPANSCEGGGRVPLPHVSCATRKPPRAPGSSSFSGCWRLNSTHQGQWRLEKPWS